MSCTQYKYYSVYNRRTDLPVCVHGKRDECMAATGLSETSFYTYVTRTRRGDKKGRYEIYVDEEDDDDECAGY